MSDTHFDYEKAMQALLYVASEIGNVTQHTAYKTLYFAEQEYMREYGNTMLGETFTKMVDGPVPSHVRDLVKMAAGTFEGRWLGSSGKEYAQAHLHVNGMMLRPLVAPDMDYLAETEKECLDHAIAHCRGRSFTDLKKESHDSAWDAAEMNKPMDMVAIAKAGGASQDAIAYMLETIANNNYCSL
jgi:hypothetical protein